MAESEQPSEEIPLQVRPMPEAKKPTCFQILANILRNITVEPTAFLMLTASLLSGMATQNLGIEKVCRVNLNISKSICDSLNSLENNAYERQVQKYISFYTPIASIITSLFPAILLTFSGGWMDLTGRRRLLIFSPVCAMALQKINNIIHVFFMYQIRYEYLVFSDAFFGSVAGGWSVMFLAVFCYISDITTLENRTHRLGLVSFCTYVGMPIGLALSGVILSHLGYYAVYGIALSMHVTNLLYIGIWLSDPARTKEQREHDGRGFFYFLKSFFDLTHIKSTLLVVFKKTDDNRRKKLCILLGCVCLLFGPMFGEISVMYLSTRYRFNWDEVQFSMFQTYNFITHTIGTIFSVLVLSKKLQWHDAILGVISTVSKIFSSFIFCFAPNGRIFYIGPIVDMLNGTALLVLRSIFSKMVAPNELGKVNSIVALTENLMPLVYVPLYTKVYTATMETLPGAVFLMGSAMTIPTIFAFAWLFWGHRKNLRKAKQDADHHTS